MRFVCRIRETGRENGGPPPAERTAYDSSSSEEGGGEEGEKGEDGEGRSKRGATGGAEGGLGLGLIGETLEEGEEGEEGEEVEEEEEEEVWEEEAQRRMRDEGPGAKYTPLRVQFTNVEEAEALLDECVAIRDRYAEFGDEKMKRPVLPDWLAEFNEPDEPDDTRWWVQLGDTNLLGLAEVRQLRGDWEGAINELENLAEFQQARAGADPREKLMVLGKLTDLARRHDLARAVWPLERSLEILRGQVRALLLSLTTPRPDRPSPCLGATVRPPHRRSSLTPRLASAGSWTTRS